MYISKKILQIAKNHKVTKRKIYENLDITPSTLDNKLKDDSFFILELQKIAEILDIPITSFFENEEKNLNIGDNNNLAIGKNASIALDTCKKEIAHLKELLKAKDEIIELYKSKSKL